AENIQPVENTSTVNEKPTVENYSYGEDMQTKPKYDNPVQAVFAGENLLDVIAPQEIEVDFDHLRINNVYFRTLFVSGYPRFVVPGWLEQLVNFNATLDITFYIYPVDAKGILDDFRHKIAEMEAEIMTDLERGKIVNPSTQAKLDDARMLQEDLVKGTE